MTKLKLVNWSDSMEIAAGHFIQNDNFFIGAVADAARLSLSGYNYGILPSKSQESIDNSIRVNDHVTDNIEVRVDNCNAVTSSGYRIHFNAEESGRALFKNYSPAADKNIGNRDVKHWDIIISVDPFSRVASGELDPHETPPRHPDCESSYELYIMPVGDINTTGFGRHYLTVGRIRKDGDRYVMDPNYIPPCTCMASHPELMDYYDNFGMLFNSLEKSSKNIIAKVHERSNKSDLGSNIQSVCEDVLSYIASIYFGFRNKGKFLPPIETVDYVSSLSHIFYASLNKISNRHKEEMLKYFYEWTDVSPGSFDELLTDTLDMEYEHDNIRSVMVRCEMFLRTFSELWERLSRLEYIGQHKENIVVSERKQDTVTTIKRSWSVTD